MVRVHLRALCDPTRSNAPASDSGIVCVLGCVRAVVSLAERLCADHWLFGNFALITQHADNRWIVCIARKGRWAEPIFPNRSRTHEHSVRVRADAFCRSCCNRYTRSCITTIHAIARRRPTRRIIDKGLASSWLF